MKIYQFEASGDKTLLSTLMREYLVWSTNMLRSEYGLDYGDEVINAIIEEDLEMIDKYLPPMGCLLIAEVDNESAGMVCLKALDKGIAEVKRMYVRPKFRRFGLGRSLMTHLLDEAKAMNYSIVRLESGKFMKNAHQLYRSLGFREIEAYEHGELPEELAAHSIFMELSLADAD